jgi:hypothetical protein
MGRRSEEFHAFDSLMGKLLEVPKSTIHERHAEHKKRAALNPNKRGPKSKTKPPSGDPDEA